MPVLKSKPIIDNLTSPISIFVGRENEVAEIKKLLSAHHLVALTGPGGSGKTRLALRVAQELSGEFEHGVWLAELSSLSESTLVPQTIASALSIHEQPGRPLMDSLVDHLSQRQTLLVIDNCEHLILACAQIMEVLLQRCPNLQILATSREALGITGEVIWMVPPLSLPVQQPWTNPASAQDAVARYEESESVQLFVVRAAALSSDFRLTAENGAWVAEICRRLDGMPLAIELAAARVRTLSIRQIAQRLDDRFHLLTEGSRTAEPRQQSLAATLDWSYSLLSSKEQKVLQKLSVFAGGATLAAAESICTGNEVEPSEVLDIVSQLVNKSLVIAGQRSGETRYHLLETIRQYGLQKLVESGDLDNSKNRHLNYFMEWAEKAEPHLDKPEQVDWLELFEAEHDNLRAALEWCSADDRRADMGLRVAATCGRFWRLHGYLSEGRTHLLNALSQAGAQTRTATRAWALRKAGNLAYLQSDYLASSSLFEESLSIGRELGDAGKSIVAHALDMLGEVKTEEGDYTTAVALFEEALSLFRELQDVRGLSEILMQFGWAEMRMGNYEKAAVHQEEFLSLARKTGYTTHIAYALGGLGELAVRQGQYERANSLLQESVGLHRQTGDKWDVAASLGSQGWAALRQSDFKRMRQLLSESLAIRMEIADKGGIAWCLEKLAQAASLENEFQKSVQIFGAAAALRAPLGSVIDPADQPEYQRLIAELRSNLGEEAFAAAWAEGGKMPLAKIVEYALSEPESTTESTRAEKEKFGGLTAREREVAVLIAQGKSNREIAKAMTIGAKTVETYVTRMLNKLGFDSRVQIATWAIENGLKSK